MAYTFLIRRQHCGNVTREIYRQWGIEIPVGYLGELSACTAVRSECTWSPSIVAAQPACLVVPVSLDWRKRRPQSYVCVMFPGDSPTRLFLT